MRSRRAIIGPTTASASVSASASQSTGGNHTISWRYAVRHDAEQPGHQRGDAGHQHDAEILHERDQTLSAP